MRRYIAILMTLMLVSVGILAGCDSNGTKHYHAIERGITNGYVTFKADKNEPAFVFEYPNYYELMNYENSDSLLRYTAITLTGPPELRKQGNIRSLTIYVGSYPRETRDVINDRIENVSRSKNNRRFKLLELTEVEFSEIRGTESIISFTALPIGDFGKEDIVTTEPVDLIYFDLVFNHREMQYIVNLISDPAMYEGATKEFAHVISTLQFSK